MYVSYSISDISHCKHHGFKVLSSNGLKKIGDLDERNNQILSYLHQFP